MLLGFKSRFAPFVEEGSKTHTIRADRKIVPHAGEICHCYVNPRQKTMRLLGRWPCVKVDPIRILITPHGPSDAADLSISINGEPLSMDEANELAWRDGFRPARRRDALMEMGQFWAKVHHITVFTGHIIHWDYRSPA